MDLVLVESASCLKSELALRSDGGDPQHGQDPDMERKDTEIRPR